MSMSEWEARREEQEERERWHRHEKNYRDWRENGVWPGDDDEDEEEEQDEEPEEDEDDFNGVEAGEDFPATLYPSCGRAN